MTKTHNIARYEYAGIDGCRCWCHLEIWQEAGRPSVVLATERLDNDGTSVTNRAEQLAEQVCREFKLEPRALIWLEAYERTDDNDFNDLKTLGVERSTPTHRSEFDRVFFEIAHGNRLGRPQWEAFGLTAAERLVEEPL